MSRNSPELNYRPNLNSVPPWLKGRGGSQPCGTGGAAVPGDSKGLSSGCRAWEGCGCTPGGSVDSPQNYQHIHSWVGWICSQHRDHAEVLLPVKLPFLVLPQLFPLRKLTALTVQRVLVPEEQHLERWVS